MLGEKSEEAALQQNVRKGATLTPARCWIVSELRKSTMILCKSGGQAQCLGLNNRLGWDPKDSFPKFTGGIDQHYSVLRSGLAIG